MRKAQVIEQTPLAVLVRGRLAELNIKQSDFCRLTGFDQGLLSKIQSSLITSLSLESVLRLAGGLFLSPETILSIIGRHDLHELVMRTYAIDFAALNEINSREVPAPVAELSLMALRAHLMNRSLQPVLQLLYPLAATQRRAERYNLERRVVNSG